MVVDVPGARSQSLSVVVRLSVLTPLKTYTSALLVELTWVSVTSRPSETRRQLTCVVRIA